MCKLKDLARSEKNWYRRDDAYQHSQLIREELLPHKVSFIKLGIMF